VREPVLASGGCAKLAAAVIRLVIADDHELLRDGLRAALDAEPDLEVVGEAADGGAAVEAVLKLRPDVVLMDVRMPRVDGIEAIRRLRAHGSEARIVVFTTFDADEVAWEALRAGASGFLLKGAPPEELVEAVRAAAAGRSLLAPQVTQRLVDRFVRMPLKGGAAQRERLAPLTERELEVLTLVARGLTNREIADRLVVTEATAKTHVARILMKLGLRDRVQAVVLAYESGLVEPGEATTP
jgi:DNA-binding NarL/FixJ family response regulator